jgi:hypothetical protein
MSEFVIRPLVPGEENLFDSMPDPLPELRQVSYADGVASGGFRPENTWVALHHGQVVARAAWLLPPGAVGEPWLEWFDLSAEPEVGAALLRKAHEALGGPKDYYASLPPGGTAGAEASEISAARLAGLRQGKERLRYAWRQTTVGDHGRRFRFRQARDAREVNAIVGTIPAPDLLTGAETAKLVRGVDLASNPLGWLSGPIQDWRVALDDNGEPVGLVAATGDACFSMIAYLGVLRDEVRDELLAETIAIWRSDELVADVDAENHAARADLERHGFKAVRSRTRFTAM